MGNRFFSFLLCIEGLLFIPGIGQAQYHTADETTVGILVETTFSGLNQPGLTPSLTIGCATYQFQIGPRITFEQMAGNQDKQGKNTFWDFGYRYGFFLRNAFTWYAAGRVEYGRQRSSIDWYYQYPMATNSPSPYLGDNSFNARTDKNQYHINFYLGSGIEFILVDKLYLTMFGAAGIKTYSGYTDYLNQDNGEVVLHASSIFRNDGWSWLSSAGIGYRL